MSGTSTSRAPLDDKTRICLGLFGGLLPTVLTLTQIDLDGVLRHFDLVTTLSWFVRTIAIIALGGVMAYLYDDEARKPRLIVAGVSAPALLAALIAGGNKQGPPAATPIHAADIPYQRAAWNDWPGRSFIVRAQFNAWAADTEPFCFTEPSIGSRIQAGITGKAPQRLWITSRQSYADVAHAEAAAKQIKTSLPPGSLLPEPTVAKTTSGPAGYVLVYVNGVAYSDLPPNLQRFAANYSGAMAPWQPGGPVILYDASYMTQLVAQKVVGKCD